MTPPLILCLWVLCTPLGYLACRWSSRRMGDRWTRNSRLFALVGSLFYGPVMPAMAGLIVLLDKLFKSEWGNGDARW